MVILQKSVLRFFPLPGMIGACILPRRKIMLFRLRNAGIFCWGLLLLATLGCGGKDNPSTSASASGTTPSANGTSPDASGTAAGGDQTGGPGVTIKRAAPDYAHPVVQIDTTLGAIKVRLNMDKSPLTVSNFLFYVTTSYYNNTIIHQVVKGQVVLAGGYDEKLEAKQGGLGISNEAAKCGLKNRRGTLAMIRLPDKINSATTQFLINVADNAMLDHRDDTPEGFGYCVFGEVIEGMDVVDQINNAAVHDVGKFQLVPVQPIVIKSVRRLN
jgi:peptidyl-prolyl cis-trans isomerase A (cyclophilin A)